MWWKRRTIGPLEEQSKSDGDRSPQWRVEGCITIAKAQSCQWICKKAFSSILNLCLSVCNAIPHATISIQRPYFSTSITTAAKPRGHAKLNTSFNPHHSHPSSSSKSPSSSPSSSSSLPNPPRRLHPPAHANSSAPPSPSVHSAYCPIRQEHQT